MDGGRTGPAVVGVWVDVAAAHDGGYVSAGEAVTVLEDRRDAERGRRIGGEAGVVEEHPHARDDRRFGDQEGVVSDQQEVPQDSRDGTSAGHAVGDGAGRAGPVVTTRRWRQEYVIAGAPSGWTQITSTSAARALIT